MSSPLCCPSRASILSGRYAHNHGVLRNKLGYRLDQRSTIEKYLQSAGYQTAIAGKFLQGIDERANPPYWDEWATSMRGYYAANFNVDGEFGRVDQLLDRLPATARKTVSRPHREGRRSPMVLVSGPRCPPSAIPTGQATHRRAGSEAPCYAVPHRKGSKR